MLFSLLLLCSPAACVNSDITSPASKAVALVADSVGRSETAVDRLFAVSREGNQTKTRVELPRVILDFPFPEMTGRTINVKAGDNLQSALNRARRGDEIVLEASAQFTGNFTLPSLRGSARDGWVVIRGSKSERLPELGTRVSMQDGMLMPAIITPNTDPAIRFEAGASGWRLVGLEVTASPAVTRQQYGLIFVGENSQKQSTLESVPSDIVLDRMYIHGQASTNLSRCVALNSARTQVSDSYITECHGKDFDSQAIWGGNGPGPFRIVNNYLAGAGEKRVEVAVFVDQGRGGLDADARRARHVVDAVATQRLDVDDLLRRHPELLDHLFAAYTQVLHGVEHRHLVADQLHQVLV